MATFINLKSWRQIIAKQVNGHMTIIQFISVYHFLTGKYLVSDLKKKDQLMKM